MMEVELVVGSNEHEYEEFVEHCSCALAQHTIEWRDVIVGLGADTPVYLLARKGGKVVGALPAFVYKCDLGNLMISIPQAGGYGGVVVERNSPYKEDVYHTLLAKLVEEAKERDCLLVTICTPPFFGELSLYRKYFRPDFEQENFFQYMDMKTDFIADLNSKQRGNIRRNIRKAQSYGLFVTTEDSEAYFNQWYAIHEKRMGELGAHPLPRLLFQGARSRMFQKNYGFFAYILDRTNVIGGAVFVGLNQVLDIFMTSSDSQHMKKQPNGILVFETVKHAQLQGYRYYNWQSCNSRRSSLYDYKAGWGSQEGLHYYLTRVVGDISELRKVPLPVIKEKYRWHYVMPYEEFPD